jgi:hypothetical protein
MSARAHSLPNGRKKGRPFDPMLADLRRMLPARSERTIARFKGALQRLHLLGFTPEQIQHAVTEATRASGSLNVRLLERYAEWLMQKGGA